MNIAELLRWDEMPEVMNKDQFASFCHVNEVQATALLDGGEIPYEANEDEKAYRIRKRDALDYLTSHPPFPAICHAPEDWYREEYRVAFPTEYPHRTQAKLKAYFTDLLAGGSDVYATQDVIDLTGYSRRAVNQWCRSGELRHFVVRNGFYTLGGVLLLQAFLDDPAESRLAQPGDVRLSYALCAAGHGDPQSQRRREGGGLMGVLADLYFESLHPQERTFPADSPQWQNAQSAIKLEEELTRRLTGEDQRDFLTLVNTVGEILCDAELAAFKTGFRLGAGLTYDTFCREG